MFSLIKSTIDIRARTVHVIDPDFDTVIVLKDAAKEFAGKTCEKVQPNESQEAFSVSKADDEGSPTADTENKDEVHCTFPRAISRLRRPGSDTL